MNIVQTAGTAGLGLMRLPHRTQRNHWKPAHNQV